MPRLSAFYGIVIYMYFADHNPPHFHAIYGEHEALIAISDGSVIGGALPRTAGKLVHQWLEIHKDELETNWRRAQVPDSLVPIEPLE